MNLKQELKSLDKYNWKGIEFIKRFYIEFIIVHRTSSPLRAN